MTKLTDLQVYGAMVAGCIAYAVTWWFQAEELPCVAAIGVTIITAWLLGLRKGDRSEY